jgi:hypothetical protein
MSAEPEQEIDKLREELDQFREQEKLELKRLTDWASQNFYALKKRVAALEKEMKEITARK